MHLIVVLFAFSYLFLVFTANLETFHRIEKKLFMCNQHLREYSHGQERTGGTAQKMKFSNKDLATFTGEILNGTRHFCAMRR